MEETFANKGILEKKLRKEGKGLAFYTTTNKLKPKTSHNLKNT
jgi:hypothetical protein